ncbi:hypothetical protein FB45DRAFT_538514 [Roridomyces roridus]|uniref:Uncharacterized protein n=1 Tax=Roridomyces roridus TaxID=1738132 RepID=A0AAD7BTS2_9AGAR|nr:hypothetical protein FB45DRAFT_538514 [Roridomyces roridus]
MTLNVNDYRLGCVKYWDGEEKEIVYRPKLREEPYPLKNLLGYYEWVYNAYWEEDREVEPGSHGHFKLGLDHHDAVKVGNSPAKDKNADVDPAHVLGEFDTCGIGSKFAGLKACERRSGWVFDEHKLVEDSEEPSWGEFGPKGFEEFDFHGSEMFITVVDVLDDNGNPFVEFKHSCGEEVVVYVGKKQKNAAVDLGKGLEGLTDGERKRLGIYVEDAEIKRVALEMKASDDDAGDAADVQDVDVETRKRRAEEDSSEEPPLKK